ncbi:MAG TPA: glycerophosphodiester phosphodiesterase [Gemmatimonadaceae bacterium]|nr:glycerophosphodiester phosphodiesterase [Gemmatimonadaceae bacterium]
MSPPEVIAHRGASRERPENTVAAFRRAVELGADGIELDVQLTADGVLVVHHDAVLPEIPLAALSRRAIRTLTSGELRRFRVRGEPVPTLAEVLRAVGLEISIYCELKGPRTAGPATALLLGGERRSAVHAFDHRQIAEARRLALALPRGILEASYHLDPTAAMSGVDARDLWMYWEMIDEPLVTAVHARGGRVVAWTVNDGPSMAALAALGVDALCTDDVPLARRTLAP